MKKVSIIVGMWIVILFGGYIGFQKYQDGKNCQKNRIGCVWKQKNAVDSKIIAIDVRIEANVQMISAIDEAIVKLHSLQPTGESQTDRAIRIEEVSTQLAALEKMRIQLIAERRKYEDIYKTANMLEQELATEVAKLEPR